MNEKTPIRIGQETQVTEAAIDRTMILRESLAVVCDEDVDNLVRLQLQRMEDDQVASAITAFNIEQAVGLKSILEKKRYFTSEAYKKQREQIATTARIDFRQQGDITTLQARTKALDILSGTYGHIMGNWQIAQDITDVENISRAISCIRASFIQIANDGRPLGGIDRRKLKQLLDQAGIPNNVQVLSAEEVENRRRQGNARQKAERLGLSPERYLAKLDSANRAYDTLTALGPFYGKD